MDKPKHKFLIAYEETASLNAQINSILSSNGSDSQKAKELRELQKNVCPLSQSHIEYYLKKIKSKRVSLYRRLICIPFVLLYLFYIIYRIYFFLHPEVSHYTFPSGLTENHLILLVALIPVLILIYYIYRYYLTRKK